MNVESRFEIGNKAEKLCFEVLDLTTSRDHYPVRFRRLADKMQEYALDIHSNVMDANALRKDIDRHNQKRFDLQTSAITTCNKLLSLVKYSLRVGLISSYSCEKLTNLALDIKYMALAWRKA